MEWEAMVQDAATQWTSTHIQNSTVDILSEKKRITKIQTVATD